ncbi:MAG: hypothetical protein K9J13_06025 [Saprospiraceae bacterium]|nr:hypothetical protein [Saprospiraceae bacterium]
MISILMMFCFSCKKDCQDYQLTFVCLLKDGTVVENCRITICYESVDEYDSYVWVDGQSRVSDANGEVVFPVVFEGDYNYRSEAIIMGILYSHTHPFSIYDNKTIKTIID